LRTVRSIRVEFVVSALCFMDKYNHQEIEKKWQKKWEEAVESVIPQYLPKPKYYVLDMFPYPSGEGLHAGHVKGYTATDILARMKKMQGFSVLHPMGWDAFGLPAEGFALKHKIHPRISTKNNIANFKRQINALGLMYDWKREINTTDPEYYKWTQWAFIKMWEKGLAYESSEPIIWCPSCQTGLAMEDLEDGKCERCGSEIERKPMRQWVIKITDYADRLLEDLNKLPGWEDSIKEMQRNWIGRSEGAEIEFSIICHSDQWEESLKDCSEKESKGFLAGARNDKQSLTVFTTRMDTLFGVTYVVLAPEHSLIPNIKSQISNINEVEEYIKKTKAKSDLERTDLNKDKTGVKLEGVVAVNPVNGEEVPVFIADYVLANYGTGAVMAVPAHDERDFAFAKKYNLPIREVVAPYLNDNPRKDKITEKRDVVTAIVKNPRTNQYLCLNWKTVVWKTFPSGGLNGEDLLTAAKRELLEETGYKNLKFIRQIGGSIYADFYRPPKDSNVESHFQYLLFELENEDVVDVSQKEKDKHEVIWVDENKIDSFINVWNQKITWKRLRQGDFAYTEDGKNVNSDFLNGLPTAEAKKKIIEWLEKEGKGRKKVNYKLNDWVFSRQRYWGEPIPMVHCDECGTVPVAEKDLPVRLPEVEHYEPTGTGESPLANITEWVNTICPICGRPAKRETNTMPQWAGSSWYYLRYIDSKNDQALVNKDEEKYWSPVDFYVGGAEHATRHLIYARFWHKFLFDIGAVNYEEPFTRLQHVGLVMAEDGRKMSKRWGNVVNPDDVIKEFGADAMRVYEMFMGPFGAACAWNTNGLTGARKFLDKIWRFASFADEFIENKCITMEEWENREKDTDRKLKNLLNKTIKKVEEDIKEFKFNTAISQMMIFVNELVKGDGASGQENITIENLPISKHDFSKFVRILAPFAPHLAEEIWSEYLAEKNSIFEAPWPSYDQELIKDETVNLVVQVNGKLRATIPVPADISEAEAVKLAQENENVKKWLEGKEIVKKIFVPGKLLNIVIK
jgi:leucyl-tRNA synthetase